MSSTEWETPQDFFDALDMEFHFTVDACATEQNAKCIAYWSKERDALKQDWNKSLSWCNHCNSFKGCTNNLAMLKFSNENLLYVQKEKACKSDIFPGAEGNVGRSEIELSGLREKEGEGKTGREKERSDRATEIIIRKETLSAELKGYRKETNSIFHRQPQTKRTKVESSLEMDDRRLGKMQGSMGEQMCLLRNSKHGINSRSFHSVAIPNMPWNYSQQYSSGVPEMQYQQETPPSSCVDKRQKTTCPDCGLFTLCVISHPQIFCNPPYDHEISKWLQKAYREAQLGATVVCLIQGRSTDTKMWHEFVMRASEIRFIKDRLWFKLNGKSSRANASSVVVVFRPGCQGPPVVSSIDTKGRGIF